MNQNQKTLSKSNEKFILNAQTNGIDIFAIFSTETINNFISQALFEKVFLKIPFVKSTLKSVDNLNISSIVNLNKTLAMRTFEVKFVVLTKCVYDIGERLKKSFF